MQIDRSTDPQRNLTLTLTRDEVPIFRLALERANFMDTPPQLQGSVIDFLEDLLSRIPADPES